MNVIFLSIIYICSAAQALCIKSYNKKTGGRGIYIWVALQSISAAIFFILTAGGRLTYVPALFVYSAAFAVSYALAIIGNAAALSYGPLSLTTLAASYSLMIPTVYGLLFLQETPSIWLFLGLILLMLSLFLINYRKGEQGGITKKWILFALICFVGNGMCSTTQKMQQVAFDGAYKNEFMIYALLALAVFMTIFSAGSEKKEAAESAKKGWYFALTYGLANGCLNLFVMVLGGKMPASIMFPLISAGQIVVSYLISRFVYRERLSKQQMTGVAIGILSIVFFNL